VSRYYVKVVEHGGRFVVLANLPSGVFASEPMSEREAMEMAVMLERNGVKKPSLWKRILGWWKRTLPEAPPSPEEEPPTCSRHPQWTAEWAGGKWVCSFCRKPLHNERPSSEERDQKGTEG
jgi:hypothetical protein